MEKDLFPPRVSDLPLADRMPRLESMTDGDRPTDHGCKCGRGDGVGDGDRNECHDHGDGGCGGIDNGGCAGLCVGYEGCGKGSWGLPEHPHAMVYAPCQVFRALYDPHTALNRGTLFTELDLPLGCESCGFTTVGDSCRVERRRI